MKPLPAMLGVLALCSVVFAQEPVEAPTAEEMTERFRKQAHAMMQQYEFTLPEQPEVTVEFVAQPLMNWTNPEAGNWEGVVYLWTAAGRPAVIASPLHHADREKMAHEFHQLIDSPLNGARNGQLVWKTERSGVEWRVLPDAPEPAETTAARSFQMRAFSRRFSAEKYGPGPERRDMRLIPKNVYRNQVETASDVIDGACFLLSQATDPEVVLLFEARQTDEGAQWYYALARLNQHEFVVSYQDEQVHRFPFVPFAMRNDPTSPYTKFYNQLYQDLP